MLSSMLVGRLVSPLDGWLVCWWLVGWLVDFLLVVFLSVSRLVVWFVFEFYKKKTTEHISTKLMDGSWPGTDHDNVWCRSRKSHRFTILFPLSLTLRYRQHFNILGGIFQGIMYGSWWKMNCEYKRGLTKEDSFWFNTGAAVATL